MTVSTWEAANAIQKRIREAQQIVDALETRSVALCLKDCDPSITRTMSADTLLLLQVHYKAILEEAWEAFRCL